MSKRSTSLPKPPNSVVFALGSTGINIIQVARTCEMEAGLDVAFFASMIGFDADGVSHNRPVPTVQKDLESVALLAGESIPGAIPDLETRRKREESGELWLTPPGWADNPGVSEENVGTGANSRSGRALFALNQNAFIYKVRSELRRHQDYQRQRTVMVEGADKNNHPPALTIFVIASTVGGAGTGASTVAIRIINEEAAKLRMNIKIRPILLLKGSLNPSDPETAARNQEMVLRDFYVRLAGSYRDLDQPDLDNRPFCEPPILVSNANNYGEINSYDGLVNLVGQFVDLYIHTALGEQLSQRIVDLHESQVKDEAGGSRCGATFGLSKINLNVLKTKAYIANQLAGSFVEDVLKNNETNESAKKAIAIAETLYLTETAAEDNATHRLFATSTKGVGDVDERAVSVFQQRWTAHR